MSEPLEHRMQIDISAEVAARGVYASFVNVWHDQDVFTLDFAALAQPPGPIVDQETGNTMLFAQAQVVSRVRIPPSQVFEIMKALETQLTRWEQETGQRPQGGGEAS